MTSDSGYRAKPRQDRSEQTVERILKAADEVYGELGVPASTTTLIAERAGLSVGALYRFYRDKTAIAEALSDRHLVELQALFDEVATIVGDGRPDNIPPAVERMVEGTAGLFKTHPGYFAVTRHLDPATPNSPAHHVRGMQLDALSAWFSLAERSPDEATRRVMAGIMIDTTRALLERTPARGAARKAHLEEATRMLTAYMMDRLG